MAETEKRPVDGVTETSAAPAAESTKGKKATKPAEKRPNAFVRLWGKIKKLVKDTCGEMRKVVWTPKSELKKSTQLVIVTVVAVSIGIAVVDVAFSKLINLIAGLIG